MLVLVEAKGTTNPVLAGQGLAGAVHGKEQVGAPAKGVTKAGVKVGDRAVEEIAEKGRPDGAAALRKGGLSDRGPAKVAKKSCSSTAVDLRTSCRMKVTERRKLSGLVRMKCRWGSSMYWARCCGVRSGKTRRRERKRVRA